MKISKLIIFSLFLFFILGAVSANDLNSTDISDIDNVKEIHVSATGDDLNLGSRDSPYATIGKAISNVNDTDKATIYLSKGTYSSDDDADFDIDLNHDVYGGNLRFIGAGVDETFIDGQSAFRFAKIGQNTNVTFKNLTFINFKAYNGGTISNKGTLYVDNCIFKDSIATGYCGGAILSNVDANLVVENSQFISCKVNSWNSNGIESQGGGAIFIQNNNQVLLQNNIFINNVISEFGGNGYAVCVSGSNPCILNNKFINITSFEKSKDSALSIWSDNGNISNNYFINCSNPSNEYSVVYLNVGGYDFENNSFINSTNSAGNVFLRGGIVNSNFIIKNKTIGIGQLEINQGFLIDIDITDDVGNIIKTTNFAINIVKENKSYLIYPKKSNGLFFINFNNVPDKGVYDLRIKYLNLLTDSLATVNINYTSSVVELYVSPDGFDGNNGTRNNPFRTIQHAVDVGFENLFNVVVILKEGKYVGDDNVNVTISNKGSLKIIGEKYNYVVIDGENRNWFLDVSSNVTVKNITFINGYGDNNQYLISGDNKLLLESCIINNCSVEDSFTLINTLVDNVTYTNNKGNIYYDEYAFRSKVLNSYFANNQGIFNGYGLIFNEAEGFSINSCKFINNTAKTKGGAVVSMGGLKCYNSYFEGNYAPKGGAIYTERQHMYYFENNTFILNKAITDGVFTGDLKQYSYTFLNCNFIQNSAKNAGVATLIVGNFTNCSFLNNSAEYGGAIIVTPIFKQEYKQFTNDDILGAVIPVEDEEYVDMYKLSFDNVIFKGNIASINGNDLFLDEFNEYYQEIYDAYIYGMDLTINFKNASVNSLAGNLEAEIRGPCNAIVGGNYIRFKLDDVDAGNAEIVNGISTLRYDGFNSNESHILTGNLLKFSNSYSKITNAIVDISLGEILNHVEVWVSPNGDDELGDGNKTKPFKTLSHAIDEATKNCRDVIIHLDEGIYDTNPDLGLKLSAKNNIALIGSGDKTIIDGGNSNYFARITFGTNMIKVQNLTIRNMGINNSDVAPITIDSNANLHLINVTISNCINDIKNDGELFIQDSTLTKNIGIISGGNIYINNSMISKSKGFIKGNVILNNSVIKDIITKGGFMLISGKKCLIENTLISNDCSNRSLKEFGIGDEGKFSPAISIESDEVNMINVSIVNNYQSPIYEYNYETGMGSKLSVFGYLYAGSRSVSCYNSSFSNFNYIWCVNGYPLEYKFDGCIFDNISLIAQSQTVGDKSKFIISNSLFLNSGHLIDRYNRGDREDPVCIFENNYWGDNEKPVVTFVNAPKNKAKSFEPKTWVILTFENGRCIFKHTDGVNVSDVANLPLDVCYALVDNQMIQVVKVGGKVYQINPNLTFEDNLVETSVLKPVVKNTVFADDLTLTYGQEVNFTAKFLYPWGDPLANAEVTFSIGNKNYTALTDENGYVGFNVDLDSGVYGVITTNPSSKQVNVNTIVVNKAKAGMIVGDVSTVYGAEDYLIAVLRDALGNAMVGVSVSVDLNGIHNLTTDENGTVKLSTKGLTPNAYSAAISFGGDSNHEKSAVRANVTVEKASSMVSAASLTTVYNGGKYLTVTLRDSHGNPISGAVVSVKIKGEKTITTNKNGEARLTIDGIAPNAYTAKITFKGDGRYTGSSTTAKVTVKKATPKLTAKKATFKAKTKTKKYVITLKDNKGKAMKKAKVTLTTKVKGKTVKLTVKTKNNGKSTFNLKKLVKGKYTVSVKFAGNKNFKATTKKVKITVKK